MSAAKSICAERIFKKDDIYIRKVVPEGIEAIRFERTGNLLQGPFKMLIITRKDSLKDAQVLFNEFYDLAANKKSVKRLQACRYELTIDSEPSFFYGSLIFLLHVGYPI